MKIFDVTKNKFLYLIFGFLIISIATPFLFTLPAPFEWMVLTGAGDIGDTIGGITSPFLGAISAILIFCAFKEQVKANRLLMEQQQFQLIQFDLQKLETDFFDISQNINNIIKIYNEGHNPDPYQPKIEVDNVLITKTIYTLIVFRQSVELINKLQTNKDFLLSKLKTLYIVYYYDGLFNFINGIQIQEAVKVNDRIITLVDKIKEINNVFGMSNKNEE